MEEFIATGAVNPITGTAAIRNTDTGDIVVATIDPTTQNLSFTYGGVPVYCDVNASTWHY